MSIRDELAPAQSLVNGNGFIEAGKDSVALLTAQPLRVIGLRLGYSALLERTMKSSVLYKSQDALISKTEKNDPALTILNLSYQAIV